jgi:DNA-directed RNA polymerase specialized sigma24 family protein
VRDIELKKDWSLTQGALHRLLNWLDAGANSAGQSYLDMRRRLVAYFDRRNCLNPDELADETLTRISRRLDEEGITHSETPAKYCYISARHVFLESLRQSQKENLLIDQLKRQATALEPSEAETKEKMLNCLERCSGQLDPQNRAIIARYYVGKERLKVENRRALAEKLNITMNALAIRACRIRDKLEVCV